MIKFRIEQALLKAKSEHAEFALGTQRDVTLFEAGHHAGFYQGLQKAKEIVAAVLTEMESIEDDEPSFL